MPSAPLIPRNDPSVLLTTAGMQQFKSYYAAAKSPYGDKVATIQKCFRLSDIDKVGDDTHLTFFEMLGHFAFNGQVSKRQAIIWGWEFLTDKKHLGIDKSLIKATYYGGGHKNVAADEESKSILEELAKQERISIQGDIQNFWGPTGDEGPCGPNVEFYINGVEVWNIVFNEFYFKNGALTPSAYGLGVDTGIGLERLTAAANNSPDLFATDIFASLMKSLAKLPFRSKRIVADHIRGVVFLLADHVRPSNKEQGYILRRILRRLLLHLRGTAIVLESLIDQVVDDFSDFYPELKKERPEIKKLAREEADRFGRTIDTGEKELDKVLRTKKKLSGQEAFRLFASYGLPIDFIKEKVQVDEAGFNEAFIQHQAVSRAGVKSKFGGHGLAGGTKISPAEEAKIIRLHTATHLLDSALRKFLGDSVHQAGSDINSERARFDFTFPRKLTDEEKKEIELWVNEQIKKDLPVTKEEMSYEAAIKSGALAFFKEKYGDKVLVYTISNPETGEIVSKELCGGPHVQRTAEIGHFRIIKEESSSAGVRRIRAVVE